MTDPALLDDPDAIVGASGAGKSYTARKKVEQLLDAKRQVIIFDPTGVWYGLRSDAAGTGRGFDVAIFGGPHGDFPIRPTDGATIARLLLDEGASAILDLSTFEEDELRLFALGFLDLLRHRERANLHLVFDEAEEFAPQTAPDDIGFQLVRRMTWIAKRGRVFGLVPTFITQRPADFAKAVLSQVQTLYFHQLIAPADQAPVKAYLKSNADADTLKRVSASLPGLERGERWIYAPRRNVLERGITAPIATFDSMATPAPGESKREPTTLAKLDLGKIRAALAGASPGVRTPADPIAAYDAGLLAGDALIARDRRIEQLETELRTAHEKRDQAVALANDGYASLFKIREHAQQAIARGKFSEVPAVVVDAAAGGDAAVGSPPPAAQRPDVASVVKSAKGPKGATIKVGGPSQPATGFRGRKALEVLAAVHPGGLTEVQWALFAGYSRKGGTWGTYKGELRRDGLVEQDGALWRATAAGVAAAGRAIAAPPAPGPALARFWAERIPGARRLVDVLIKRFPHYTTRDALAADLGMTAAGGTFGTYLGRARSNELLEEQGRRLRLSPAIMGQVK